MAGDLEAKNTWRLEEKAAEEVAFEAKFKEKKDSFGTFAYIMAMAEVIRNLKGSDPSANCSFFVATMATYVQACPPNPGYFLEIRDLEGFGVDLFFFVDQGQVVRPKLVIPVTEFPPTGVDITSVEVGPSAEVADTQGAAP